MSAEPKDTPIAEWGTKLAIATGTPLETGPGASTGSSPKPAAGGGPAPTPTSATATQPAAGGSGTPPPTGPTGPTAPTMAGKDLPSLLQQAAAAVAAGPGRDLAMELEAEAIDYNGRLKADEQRPKAELKCVIPKETYLAVVTAASADFLTKHPLPAEDAEHPKWVGAFAAEFGGPRKSALDKALRAAFPLADSMKAAGSTPKLSDAECERLIKTECKSSWKAVKKRFLATDRFTMQQIVLYRKRVVDGVLNDLNTAAGGKLVAKSVGSNNLTSDYDITVSSKDEDGSGIEVNAVRQFNDRIKAKFGAPPGACFDTNLYAKDFVQVTDMILAGGKDQGNVEPVLEFLKFDTSDQDVAALSKQRRYMTGDEWFAYVDEICRDMEAQGIDFQKIMVTRQQMEEAEARFLQKNREIYDRFLQKNAAVVADLRRTNKEFDGLLKRYEAIAADVRLEGELNTLLEKLTHAINEHDEALLLDTTNDLYLDKVLEVRAIQKKRKDLEALNTDPLNVEAITAKLTDAADARQETDVTRFAAAPDKKKWLQDKIDAMKEQSKNQLGDANFFAAEGYHSEGPLQHIVNGVQSKNPAVFEQLKPEHFLESFNEQYGDFLKDVTHYKDNPAEVFCQTAKYLQRMFEAVELMRRKPLFAALTVPSLEAWGSAAAIDAQITAKLLPIRGAKGAYALMTDEERMGEAEKAGKEIYGVKNVGELKAKFQTLNKEINMAVRKQLAMAPEMGDDVSGFSRSRERTPDDARR